MDLTDTAFGHQTGIAFVTVYAIQFLKNSKWFPWLHADAARVNRTVSLIVAFLAAAGIKVAMNGHFPLDPTTITIQVPSIGAVLDTLMHFATQFGLQEVIYQSTKAVPEPKLIPVREAEPQEATPQEVTPQEVTMVRG